MGGPRGLAVGDGVGGWVLAVMDCVVPLHVGYPKARIPEPRVKGPHLQSKSLKGWKGEARPRPGCRRKESGKAYFVVRARGGYSNMGEMSRGEAMV